MQEGGIDVIGTKTVRDQSVDPLEKKVSRSTLHKFTSSGGWVAQTPFPVHPGSRGGGGTSPPTIGPKGQVYAIASNILLVFPPPLQLANRPTQGTMEKTQQ